MKQLLETLTKITNAFKIIKHYVPSNKKKQCFTLHTYIYMQNKALLFLLYILPNTVWYWNAWYFIKNIDEKDITDKAKQSN